MSSRSSPCRPVPAVRQRLPEAGFADGGARAGRRARHAEQEAIAGDGLESPAGAVPCLRQLAPVRSLLVPPTAMQALAAGQDTPRSASWVAAAFRLASTARAGTLAGAAGIRPAAAGTRSAATGTPAAAGATPSRPAAISPAAAGASSRSQRPGAGNGDLIEPMSTP
jgi:hypothetical protein